MSSESGYLPLLIPSYPFRTSYSKAMAELKTEGDSLGLACHESGVAARSQFSFHEAILRRTGHLQLGGNVMT